MPTGPDTSYNGQTKVYTKQQPAGTTLNGSTIITEEVVDVGGLVSLYGNQSLNGQMLPAKIVFTIAAAGGANHCQVTVQVADNSGNAVAGVFDLDVILSDAATGAGVTATAPSVGMTIAVGTSLNAYVANKAFYIQTDATGKCKIDIGDASKTGYYVMVQAGCQPFPSVSRQLVTADYA